MSGNGNADVTGQAKSLSSANCRPAFLTVDEFTGCNSPHAMGIQSQACGEGEYTPIQEKIR